MSSQATGGSFTCKQRTRERILASAGRAFGRKGYAGSGVDGSVREAGLAHGGFYARFRSKGALFAEAVVAASGRTAEPTGTGPEARGGVAWLRAAVRR